MTPKRTSAAEARRTPVRVVIVTMDTHLSSATERARVQLEREIPGLRLSMHAAAEYADSDAALQRCISDIGIRGRRRR